MKKLISISLTVVMLCSIFNITLISKATDLDFEDIAEIYTEGDFTFSVSNDGVVSVFDYIGNDAEVVIPASSKGKKVSHIDGGTFYEKNDIKSVTIPDSIVFIGNGAFYECKELISVNIPESVKTIEHSAFSLCEKLSSVTIPDSVTSLGAEAFSGCSALKSIKIGKGIEIIEDHTFGDCKGLTNVTIPDSVKIIKDYAFNANESLTDVYIGKNLYAIGEYVFTDCNSLTNFKVSESNKYIYSVDGVLFNKYDELVAYPIAKPDTHYSVPEGTTAILSGAFSNCDKIKSIEIPDGVESIGDNAFRYCNFLSSIKIADSIKRIGYEAFARNPITEFDFPQELTCIDDNAFAYSRLTSVHIPSKVSDIGFGIFNASEVSISVDPENEHLCVVDDVLFSKDMKKLYLYSYKKEDALYVVPEGVEEIYGEAFYGAKISSVSFPESLKEIGYCAFELSKLDMAELIIPDNVTAIANFAFTSCEIDKFVFGKSLRSLGRGVNQNLFGESEIYFKGNGVALDEPFESGTTVYYPAGDTTWTADLTREEYIWKTWDTPVFNREDISKATVTLSNTTYVFNYYENKPEVNVKMGTKLLKEGEDYKLNYENAYYPGTATVTVTGINNYQGKITKDFTITKCEQPLSASVSADSIPVGGLAKVTVSAFGNVSFKSSNTDCAVVDSYGYIYAKSKGSTKITVTTEETNCYKQATKTLTVNVVPISNKVNLNTLTYSFGNDRKSFGYNLDYRIPLDRFYMFFSKKEAKELHKLYGFWGGNCAGMTASSILFNTFSDSLDIQDFNSSAKKVSNLTLKNKSSKLGITVKELIESLQVAQSRGEYYYSRRKNKNNIQSLFNIVKMVEKGGAPVWMAVFDTDGSGHALVGYKTEKINKQESRIYVYDCNYPKTERYIKVNTNTSGECTGWSYSINDKYKCGSKYYNKGSSIDYIDYEIIKYVWESRNTNGTAISDFSPCNSMIISNDDFQIQNQSGTVIATMEDGVFNSTVADIYENKIVQSNGENQRSHLIYMPTTEYEIVNTGEDNHQLELTMVNNQQTVEIDTFAESVNLHLDDAQGANVVDINGEKGVSYRIEMSSVSEISQDEKSVIYRGRCGEDVVSVGISEGELFSNNSIDSTVIVDDKYINFSNNNADNISRYDIYMDDYDFKCDGTRKEPEVTLCSDYGYDDLIEGVDYEVVYSNNVQAGEATVTVYGINKFKGVLEKTFNIEQGIITQQLLLSFSAKEDEVQLGWNKVDFASGYDIQQYIDNEWITIERAPNGNIESYIVKDLSAYTNYKFRIRPYVANGADICYGKASSEVNVRTTKTATPKITKIKNIKGGTTVKWSKVDGADKYRLFKKDGNKWIPLVTTVDTSFTHKISVSGSEFTYMVRCLSNDEKVYTSGYDKKGIKNTYVAQPEIKKFKNINGGIKINWTKVKGAEKYRLFRKTTKGWKTIVTTNANSYIYKVSDSKSNTIGTYSVRCVNSKGSKYTSSWNTKGYKHKYIATPKIKSVKNTLKGIKFTFNKVKGAQKYRIYRKTATGDWKKIADVSKAKNLYIDKNVKKGKKYLYTVGCVTFDGKSLVSGYTKKGQAIKRQ